jgi:protoheme IX farnesyltransferase
MPHVIGLSIYRRHEYERAGIRVLPLVHGTRAAQFHAIAWAALLVPVSVLPAVLGFGGRIYFACALLLGAAYLGSTLLAVFRPSDAVDRWGRRVFFCSLLYLPLLLSVLMLDKAG